MSKENEEGKDLIVQSVIERFNERSSLGIKKYGTTLTDNNSDDFLTHLQEELMDAVLYIEKLKEQREKNHLFKIAGLLNETL